MTDFFNYKTKGFVVRDVKFMIPKRVRIDLSVLANKRWSIRADCRGKEMKLIFQNGEERKDLLLNLFKGGIWEWYENEEATRLNPDYDRDHRFSLHFENGAIMSQQDQFHQSHWRWSDVRWGGWEQYRSPDIVLEYNAYRKHMYKHKNHFHFKKPIFQIMHHQWFFNGISNISRCEILARTRFSPFTTVKEILSSEILREDFFENTKEVLEELYLLGGTQLGNWKNPFGVDPAPFKKWIRVYNHDDALLMYDDRRKKLWYDKKWKIEGKYYTLKQNTKKEDLHDGPTGSTDI